MYLFTYLSRIIIVYRLERNHNNANDLSRLSINYANANCYLVITIVVNKEFLHSLRDALKIDLHFRKIYEKIEKQVKDIAKNFENPSIVYQSYQLNANIELLYLINKLNLDRVYISKLLEKKVLEFAHDNYVHDGHHRTLDRLKIVCYFLKIRSKIHAYIDKCLVYQLSKPSRRLLDDQLNFIETTTISLSQLAMDFVVALLMITQENNSLLTIIDRFSKYIRLILDKKI